MPQRAVETSQAHRGARGDKGRALVRVCACGGACDVCECACVWWSMTTNLSGLDHRARQVHVPLELDRIGGEEPILVLMVSVLCFGKAHDQQVGTYSLKYSTAAWVRFINST